MGSHGVICHPTQVNTPHLPSQRPVLDLPTPKGWKVELIGYIPRWFTRPQMVTHQSNNPAVYGWELNLQPADHKSDALTTTSASHIP